jgi:hypothetical protein
VVRRALESQGGEVGDEVRDRAPVDAVAVGEAVKRVEHLELQGTGLVNRADDGATLDPGQPLQQGDALAAGGRVQTWRGVSPRIIKSIGWMVGRGRAGGGDKETAWLTHRSWARLKIILKDC